jgi:excisionase family DNA binding protein
MSDRVRIDPQGIYAVGAAARLLGVSASTLRDLERRGRIEGERTPGRQRRFTGVSLLRLLEESNHHPPKRPGPSSGDAKPSNHDIEARQAWLGQVVARAQRELSADTPAEIRLRLAADLEGALRAFGPPFPPGDVAQLVNSMIERARLQGEKAREEAERRQMKDNLREHALAHLRRSIDALPISVVGAPRSLERRHVRATLRDQLQSIFQKRFLGDEDWDQARELADELLAAWYVKRTPASRIPNTVKLAAAGLTGVVGGAAAAAALDPRIRAAASELKEPLRAFTLNLLNHFKPPAPSTPPSTDSSNQATPPQPSSAPTASGRPWPSYSRRTLKYRALIARSRTQGTMAADPTLKGGRI